MRNYDKEIIEYGWNLLNKREVRVVSDLNGNKRDSLRSLSLEVCRCLWLSEESSV